MTRNQRLIMVTYLKHDFRIKWLRIESPDKMIIAYIMSVLYIRYVIEYIHILYIYVSCFFPMYYIYSLYCILYIYIYILHFLF